MLAGAAEAQAIVLVCKRKKTLRPAKQQVVLALAATDHCDADPGCDLVSHVGKSGARQQKRNAHLGTLDDHLTRQPAGGVKNLVGTVDALLPHPAGDCIDCIVAPNILNEIQNLATLLAGVCAQCAAMHRTRHFINGLMASNPVHHRIQHFPR